MHRGRFRRRVTAVVGVLGLLGALLVALTAAPAAATPTAAAPAPAPAAAAPAPAVAAGPIEVKVPDIGDFKDVAVIEVLAKPGDTIKEEQSLITVESDKASMHSFELSRAG